jgi:hypothetical protein
LDQTKTGKNRKKSRPDKTKTGKDCKKTGLYKESGIWKHQRCSPAVWTAAVSKDDLITAKALTAHSADQRQVTNLQFAAGFVSRPPFPPTAQWL